MATWVKYLVGVLATLGILAGTGWVFRAEIALWGISQVMSSQMGEIGPAQEINWSSAVDARDKSERPPNIVLILADDLGWNDISMNGPNPTTETPHIDALAEGGVTFTQGYAANATCAPSRAALMSGRYGTRFGFEFTPTPTGFMPIVGLVSDTRDRPLMPPGISNTETAELEYAEMGMPASEVTLAEVLKDKGYHTVHIGKWHLGNTNGMAAHEQGFAESLLMASGLYGRADDEDVIQARQEFDPIDRFLWSAMRFAARFNGGPLFEPPRYLTDYYTDEAVKVIEANKDRPFFLYLAHWAPHTPLQAAREDYEALSHIELHRERVYAGMIRSLDRGVGRVMEALKANGIDDNTLVMFTSDNGGADYIGLPDVNDPYRGWKITLFEGGIRVPMFVKWPAKIAPGTRIDTPVAHIDVMPTLAAAGGAPLPDGVVIDGQNMLPAAMGESALTRPNDALFWSSGAYRVVRAGDWKLQVNGLQEKSWLFDLANDPTEQTNLIDARPDKRAELEALLADHYADAVSPLYPHTLESPILIDKPLGVSRTPDDEYVMWPN